MKMNRPEGFLFDFGDTILHHEFFDPRRGNLAVYEQTHNPERISFDDIQTKADELLTEFLSRSDSVLLEVRCGSLIKLVYESFGLELGKPLLDIERIFRQGAVHYRLADGIHEILDLLDSFSIKKGIISNTIFPAALLEEDLDEFGLGDRFEFVIASSDYVLRKPHPMLFQLAARKLDLPAEHIWFAGDTLQYDVSGAIQAGMHPVWYNFTGQAGQENLSYSEIHNWRELVPVILDLCTN